MPQRIQRQRTKGWRMPAGAVYVGRPTMWGNYAAARLGLSDPHAAADAFECWVEDEASEAWKASVKAELKGKDLACWCSLDHPCHAGILLVLANT